MIILQIINSLGNGGAEKLVVEISNELVINNRVTICSLRPIEEKMLAKHKIDEKINLVSLNKNDGFSPYIYYQLYRLFKSQKPNIIHFHLDATIKYIIPLIPLFRKIKFIHTIHSDLNSEKKIIYSKLKYLKFFTKKIAFVCISNSIYKDFQINYPFLRFFLIENGIKKLRISSEYDSTKIEVNNLKFNEKTKVFLTIGRIDENKNHLLIINSFKKLVNKNIICLIIGDDPSENKEYFLHLKSLCSENTYFLGSKNNIADYLSLANCFIISSKNEGLPITAIEALSFGLPIITTDSGGLKDIVENEKGGFILKNINSDELIKSIDHFLLLDETQITNIKKFNINKFEQLYSINRCCNSHLKLYNNQ